MAVLSADKRRGSVLSPAAKNRSVSSSAAKTVVVVPSCAETSPPTPNAGDASSTDACAGLPTYAHLQARSNAALGNTRMRIKVPPSPVPGATFEAVFRRRRFDVVTPDLDAGVIFYCKLPDPAQVNIIPVSERSFSNSHFKRLYGTAKRPEYQVRVICCQHRGSY